MWHINFVSLRKPDITYTAKIYGGGSDVINLTGADVPFVTQEDSDDDMFLPVRTQSG